MFKFLRRRPKPGSATGTVDLYLGPAAAWVLNAVAPEDIRRVITYGGSASRRAKQQGVETLLGDCNTLDFTPSGVALSVHYPVRISPGLLSHYRTIYNLHPGYLPWCRGLSSVSWAMWEGAPAGATLHEMTEELDAGPIVDRIEVAYGPDELYGEVQKRVQAAERRMFERYWPRIAAGERLPAQPQTGVGSSHTRNETARFLRRVKKEDHWRSMETGELIKLLRSFGGLDLEHGSRTLRLNLSAAGSRTSGEPE